MGEQKSLYLLQHKDNPVWWHAWGSEAFELAKKEGKLRRRYRKNEAKYAGTLDDYAYFISGLIELYESDNNIKWIEHAIKQALEGKTTAYVCENKICLDKLNF